MTQIWHTPFGSATSACSSLGLCLNLALPQCRQAAHTLYMPIFSSSAKPSVLAACWQKRRTHQCNYSDNVTAHFLSRRALNNNLSSAWNHVAIFVWFLATKNKHIAIGWSGKCTYINYTDLSNTKFFNVIDSVSFFRTFLEELIIRWFVWLNEKFFWKENNFYAY